MDYPIIAETRVQADWIDYNGHMRDGYYVIAFSAAIDDLMDRVGLDAAYRERTGCTLYTLEIHLYYLAEVKQGEPLTIRMRVLGLDEKRLHALFLMERSDGTVISTQDTMLLHVDQAAGPGAAPFPEATLAHLEPLFEAHRTLPMEKHIARAMGLKRKPS